MEEQRSFERYDWLCPECKVGHCAIINVGDSISAEFKDLDKTVMRPPIDLEILNALELEQRPMRAGEIAALIDFDYRWVGRKTSKLRDGGLVRKEDVGGNMQNSITPKAKSIYFGGEPEVLDTDAADQLEVPEES
jgi:DNA-binding transcriptional ArsR family regulator